MTGTSGSRTGHERVRIVDDEPALDEVLSGADPVPVPVPGPVLVAFAEGRRRPHRALGGRNAPRTAVTARRGLQYAIRSAEDGR